MKVKKSIKINAVLYMMTTTLGIIYPLITFPYVSHILDVDSLGKVNYGSSIVSYFSLLATLGISTYAVREGVKYRDNKKLFNEFANQIFTTNIITTCISYVLLFVSLFFLNAFKEYKTIILIQSISIALATLGVNWVNSIYEDYLFITIRTLFVQIFSIILMFLLVRTSRDYYWYATLTVLSNGLTSVFNIFYCKKYVSFRLTKNVNFLKHIKSTIVFFASNLAITIYVSSDTTMIGMIKGDYYTGLYSMPVKVYSITKSVLTCIYTVAIPRLALAFSDNRIEEYKKLLTELVSYIIIIGMPAVAGIFSLSEEIVKIVSGEKYMQSATTLRLLSIALLFSLLSGLAVNGMNITIGKEKNSLKATFLAAVVNIFLNIFLIPLFAQNGAAFTTIIAEGVVTSYCCILIKNELHQFIDLKKIVKQMGQAAMGSLLVVVICMILKMIICNILIRVLLSIGVSVITYIGTLILLKNDYIKEIIHSGLTRIHKRA